jgi:hypothetical protein
MGSEEIAHRHLSWRDQCSKDLVVIRLMKWAVASDPAYVNPALDLAFLQAEEFRRPALAERTLVTALRYAHAPQDRINLLISLFHVRFFDLKNVDAAKQTAREAATILQRYGPSISASSHNQAEAAIKCVQTIDEQRVTSH